MKLPLSDSIGVLHIVLYSLIVNIMFGLIYSIVLNFLLGSI